MATLTGLYLDHSPLIVKLAPTKRVVQFNGVAHRVWVGVTNTGTEVEMLGLFRVIDPAKRPEFEAQVCAVNVGDEPPSLLFSSEALANP